MQTRIKDLLEHFADWQGIDKNQLEAAVVLVYKHRLLIQDGTAL
jgi:hypothetical protein